MLQPRGPRPGPRAERQGAPTGHRRARLMKAGRQSVLRQIPTSILVNFCGVSREQQSALLQGGGHTHPGENRAVSFLALSVETSLLVPPRPKIVAYGSKRGAGASSPLQGGTWDRGRRSLTAGRNPRPSSHPEPGPLVQVFVQIGWAKRKNL